MTTFISDSFENDVNFNAIRGTFRNTPKIKKLLFGRKDFNSESLFEKFLSIPSKENEINMDFFDETLKCIWNEFRLWEKPEILTLVSIIL